MTRVHIIGVPMDLGAGRRGVDMGPSALRIAGIAEHIRAMGHEVTDRGDLRVDVPEALASGDPKARFLGPIQDICWRLAKEVEAAAAGAIPVVLGGDHSLAVGTVAGIRAQLATHGQPYALLWVDAHGDLNTPATTPTGNIHGMPLAAIRGLGPAALTEVLGPLGPIPPERVAVVGIRNLDRRERANLEAAGVAAYTMSHIDRVGMGIVAEEAVAGLLRDGARLHISFDMDAVDPAVARGVGTPVRGGLSYREAHLLMEIAAQSHAIAGLDLVETNPILDNGNQTAELGVELALSALGKRIL